MGQDGPHEDADAVAQRRLWIGGLNQYVDANDVRERFTAFGNVLDVDIPHNDEGNGKGFAYLTMETTEDKLKRAKAIYASTKWKGMMLKIEDSKPDYLAKLKREWQETKAAQDQPFVPTTSLKQLKQRKKRALERGMAMLAEDMSLINDDNVKGRRGWTLGRYGRAIMVHHARDPITRKIIRLDPAKHKSSLQKLSERVNVDVPVKKLTWTTDQEAERLQQERLERREARRKEFDELMKEYAKQFPPVVKKSKPKAVAPPKQATKPHVLRGVISFESDGEQKSTHGVVSFESDEDIPHAPVVTYNSDDEPEDISAVSGCPKGYEDANVISRDSDEEVPIHVPGAIISELEPGKNDAAAKTLSKERQKTLSLLRSMFGRQDEPEEPVKVIDVDLHVPVKSQVVYHSDSSAGQPLQDSLSQESSSSDSEGPTAQEESSGSGDESWDGTEPSESDQESAQSDASGKSAENNKDSNFLANEDTYQVNTNLRSLIYGHLMKPDSLSSVFNEPQESSFSLSSAFGFAQDEPMEEAEAEQQPSDAKVAKAFGHSKLFFFHFDDPFLSKRMMFREGKAKPFTRTQEAKDIVEDWEASRQELTQEFKRKSKSVKRRRLRHSV